MNIHLLPVEIVDWLMTNFETEQERLMALQRLEIAKAVIRLTQAFAPIMDGASDLKYEFDDSGGNFTDEEVEPLGVAASDINDAMNFLNNLSIYAGNGVPLQGTWRTVVNRVRRVQA